jgi:hypothetical protein
MTRRISKLEIEEDPDWLPPSESNDKSQWIVPLPKGGSNLDVYRKIVKYLQEKKNIWTELKNLRRLFSDDKFNICLHDVKKVSGSKGLLWRQERGKNTPIEYCWRE